MLLKKTLPPIILIFVFSFLLVPSSVFADCQCYCNDADKIKLWPVVASNNNDECVKGCNGLGGYDTTKGCVLVTGSAGAGNEGSSGSISLTDPLNINGSAGPETLYGRIIFALLSFIGVASLVTFVYAGFVFIFSAGSPEKVKKAKDTMLYAVIGVFVAMASYAILSFIFKTLEGSFGS